MPEFPFVNRATEALLRLRIRLSRRAREEAALAAARERDADEVGRRADARASDRRAADTKAGPGT